MPDHVVGRIEFGPPGDDPPGIDTFAAVVGATTMGALQREMGDLRVLFEDLRRRLKISDYQIDNLRAHVPCEAAVEAVRNYVACYTREVGGKRAPKYTRLVEEALREHWPAGWGPWPGGEV